MPPKVEYKASVSNEIRINEYFCRLYECYYKSSYFFLHEIKYLTIKAPEILKMTHIEF